MESTYSKIAVNMRYCGIREDWCAKVEMADEFLQALRDLTGEVPLRKLNVRKDFSLMNAHACALKVIHKYESAE